MSKKVTMKDMSVNDRIEELKTFEGIKNLEGIASDIKVLSQGEGFDENLNMDSYMSGSGNGFILSIINKITEYFQSSIEIENIEETGLKKSHIVNNLLRNGHTNIFDVAGTLYSTPKGGAGKKNWYGEIEDFKVDFQGKQKIAYPVYMDESKIGFFMRVWPLIEQVWKNWNEIEYNRVASREQWVYSVSGQDDITAQQFEVQKKKGKMFITVDKQEKSDSDSIKSGSFGTKEEAWTRLEATDRTVTRRDEFKASMNDLKYFVLIPYNNKSDMNTRNQNSEIEIDKVEVVAGSNAMINKINEGLEKVNEKFGTKLKAKLSEEVELFLNPRDSQGQEINNKGDNNE